MKRRIFLIDGYALIYRAFFAMLSRPLTTSRGENTSVAWGIANFLLRLSDKHHPDAVAWVHDSGTSFRHEQLPEYKATREKLGAELQQDFDRSIERVEELLRAFSVPLVAVPGYEADDVIATLAVRFAAAGNDVVIVSGDKDFYQLIGPRISLLNPGRGGPAAVDEQLVTAVRASERLGVPPERVVDFLALVGDSADNVPGVSGIGEKTAQKLIAEYGDLESILAAAPQVQLKRAREALLREGDKARLSRSLVTLHTDAPLEAGPEDFATRSPDWRGVVELCRELEFHSLARQLAGKLETPGGPEAAASAEPGGGGSAEETPAPAAGPARVVESPAGLGAIVAAAREERCVALWVETDGGDPMRATLVGLAVATGPTDAWYLPLAHGSPGEMFESPEVRNLPPLGDPAMAPLASLLGDEAVAKIGHDLKPALLLLRRSGAEPRGVAFDTMIAAFLIDPGRRVHSLDAAVLEHYQQQLQTREHFTGSARAAKPFAEVPVREAARYSCANALAVWRLREALGPLLAEQALDRVFRAVELPLIAVLAAMEWQGIAIDAALFARLAADFRAELGAMEKAIHQAAGTEFNLLSTPQLRHVLFDKLMLPVIKKTKTGASTDAEVLEELAAQGHEVPRLILEYREVSKLLSTYLESLPGAVNPATGRIHTSFNQIGAQTGRLSSNDPNLQNIPVRTPRGEAIRRGFVPRPGWKFVVADYSQIELRLLAHLSHDEAFVAAFRAGGDIHRQTAAVIFGVEVGDVTAVQRAQAKTINFATIYGQGAHSLSRQLGISREDARRFIEEYFARFAGVRSFLDECVSRAREKGYAETIFGRRRYIPELKDRNFNARAFGERTATNSPIQGSAADLIKIAMVRVQRALEAGHEAKLLLQVHDELVVEAPAPEAGAVAELLKREMEGVASLDVPLLADVGVGDNWLDAKH
jgi:DNA polymerase-1